MNNGGMWLGIAGIAILLAWYALAAAWLKRRRHVPAPPKLDAVLSPAEIRFLYKGVCDGRTLLVAILDLVARGALSLKQRSNGTAYIERSLDAVDDSVLPEDAAIVRAALFRAGNRMVDLTDAREDALLHAGIALRRWLERRYIGGPGLTRRGWVWLLVAGGALAAGVIVMIAAGTGVYGIGYVAALVGFYVFGLVSVVSTILFVQQFFEVNFVLKLVIVLTIVSMLPIILVLIAGTLIDYYDHHGVVGILPFVLPLIGSWLLMRIGRSQFELLPSAIRQMDAWHQRLQVAPDGTGRSGTIDPQTIVAVALDAGDDAFGRLGPVFDDLAIPSGRIRFFGAPESASDDFGSIGLAMPRW
jgi:hypothetical protein